MSIKNYFLYCTRIHSNHKNTPPMKKAPPMNAFYIVVKKTSWAGGEFASDVSLKKALKKCKAKLSDNIVIYQGLVSSAATPAELENLSMCFTVDSWGNIVMYANPTKKDSKMAKRLMKGWVVNKDFEHPQK